MKAFYIYMKKVRKNGNIFKSQIINLLPTPHNKTLKSLYYAPLYGKEEYVKTDGHTHLLRGKE